ncbi:MBL fold metallo-hydrolase [Microbacterium sp. B2969]|uniref:MBL fold metallo-hydrolase n=1 Tax=Microbacterium alkaliflavum TaxID=3248839 RepID=A0ABW7Q8Z7_9MICO
MSARWITLGTCGGPFQRPEAFQISNALVVGDDVYLFDAGNGVLRRLTEAGIDLGRIKGVFVTHHHPDHIADLGLILLTHWLKPGADRIVIGGPRGTAHLVDGLAAAYRFTEQTEAPEKPGIADRVTVRESTDAAALVELYRDDAILLEAIEVAHFRSPDGSAAAEQPHAIGLRITTADRVIAYTGDTGATAALEDLARDADLFVSEVVDVPHIVDDLRLRFASAPAVVERVEFNMRHNHLAPKEIGRVAAAAGVRSVLLTHFVPVQPGDGTQKLVRSTRAAAGGIPVAAAHDLGEY